MLIRFRLENFRSFRDEQELSFVASSLRDLPEVVREVKGIDQGLVTVAAIYGANASGKSNVLKALAHMEAAVRLSHRSWKPEGPIRTEPFLLDEESGKRASTFEVDLLLDGVRFQYGFTLSSEAVLREWLYAYPSARKQTWLLREGQAFRFGKQLLGENRAIENLTRKNSLFLSAAAQNNHEQLSPLYRWFADDLYFVTERREMLPHMTAELCKGDDGIKKRIAEMIGAADLGIIGFDVMEEILDDRYKTLAQAFASALEVAPDDSANPITVTRPALRHRSAQEGGVSFQERNESAGTLAWLGLLGPMLSALEAGGTLCIDELDASLHPVLAKEIVALFNNPKRNQNQAQLIFSSHDTNLLDPELLRRDQIWFVEKDRQGSSHLYPLTDFKPRKDENLERGYLQGRYGAIPFVGPLRSNEQ
jgi:hypothetical protein